MKLRFAPVLCLIATCFLPSLGIAEENSVDQVEAFLKENVINRIRLADFADQWVRPLSDWSPDTKNVDRQFKSLSRHLLVEYEVPAFMDAAWFGESSLERRWYCWVAAGKNIRKAPDLPVSLTKAMAHQFLSAPSDYSIGAALRWGQIRSLEGDGVLCDAVAQTRLVRDFEDDAFWMSVFRFFVDNPMLDRAHVGPIIDFIWNRRFEPVIRYDQPGVPIEREPEQPNFSMRGRTAEGLLRAVAIWHGQLGEDQNRPMLQWQKSYHPDYEFMEGSGEEPECWSIRELLTTQELVAEGKEMRHCVASYDRSCAGGRCSIWTVRRHSQGAWQPHLTVELGHPENKIRQARGKQNRLPTHQEQRILDRWIITLENSE